MGPVAKYVGRTSEARGESRDEMSGQRACGQIPRE